MKSVYVLYLFAAATLLPRAGWAATYNFTSFQYPGADTTFFTGIDDYNRIVGYTFIGNSTQGFMITSSGMLSTIAPSGAGVIFAVPAAINRNGGVVGADFGSVNVVMFIDSGNGFRGLPQDVAGQTITGINSTSNSVGNFISSSGAPAVYLKHNGTYNTLLPAGACVSTADPALNDFSTVVGSCATGTSNTGFIWTKGKYTYIQPPAGSGYIHPTSINNSGVIAGWYTDTSGFNHGFVLSGTTFTTVDYPSTDASNTLITGINNSGRIVGYYNGARSAIAFSAVAQ